MRALDTLNRSIQYTFNPLKISVGLRSGDARASVAPFASAIRAVSDQYYELVVDSFHIESSNDWVHFIVTVRPTSGSLAAMPVSQVRDIHDRLISHLTSQFSPVLCFVWPTGARTPLSAEQLHDAEQT
jgi:hypothetical protein